PPSRGFRLAFTLGSLRGAGGCSHLPRLRPSSRLRLVSNCFDLDPNVDHEPGLSGAACRWMLREEAGIDLIELGEILGVLEPDGRLDDVGEGAAGQFEGCLHV